MTPIEPNLSKEEALRLLCKLHTKFKNIDYSRALNKHEAAAINRMDLHELVEGLEKLKTRLEFSI
jgi:hypothetical protein